MPRPSVRVRRAHARTAALAVLVLAGCARHGNQPAVAAAGDSAAASAAPAAAAAPTTAAPAAPAPTAPAPAAPAPAAPAVAAPAVAAPAVAAVDASSRPEASSPAPQPAAAALSQVVVQHEAVARARHEAGAAGVAAGAAVGSAGGITTWPRDASRRLYARMRERGASRPESPPDPRPDGGWNREGYDRIEDNPFLAVAGNPRSTFSIDVDRASYGNVRRFLAQGQRPPADAVRIEELVNYFPYALPAPRGEHPIAVTTEVMPAPWRTRHQLVRVALQARPIETAELPPSNLVFLVDVSGSMQSPDKLPLVKQALGLLVAQMRPRDRVALVVYAGAAGLILPPTSGREKSRIMDAIDRLEAGGSTAGGEGLLLAYRIAREAREASGGRTNTRVVLATDGDFNVGVSSDAALERLVEAQRASGIYLTVLGFGTGNYQDAKMEKLAKQGNGNYAYVDDLAEARKVLVQELGATLHVVAQDVKLQVEFNPAAVRAYRLLGYENRLLRDEDFADDRKDAGDVGAGHSVTALYEVVPAGVEGTVAVRGAEPLRYGEAPARTAGPRDELLFVQLRYKRPGESQSRLLRHPVRASDAARTVGAASADFRFAAAVSGFGMLLRDSEHKGDATPDRVLGLARGALGTDPGGYRAEFLRLVERWRTVEGTLAVKE